MFGSASGNVLKPRYRKSSSILPLPATFKGIHHFQKQNVTYVTIILILIWVFLSPFHFLGDIWKSKTTSQYRPSHPLTSVHTIETSSRFIYPPIEHASLLKELTVHKLVKESKVRDSNFPEIEKTLIDSLNIYDDPNPISQKLKEDEENALSDLSTAKNYFKNQDKVVFKPKNKNNYPEVIVVTAVDFEKYSLDALAKIVQNRVDYAHQQNYGIYVRWYQEFLPVLNSLSYLQLKEKAKWVRLYCLRAAMFAFPEAKWFWYLDQDALIMDHSINLQDYILSSDALNPIMLREQPIIPPNGAIKTYKNLKAESVKLIVTQSESKVETHSFLVKNDHISRSIIDIWGDRLYLTYSNFPYGPDSALTHILQWHPFILSQSTIIPARTIAAQHTDVELPQTKNNKGDHIHYYDGDFVVQWNDCDPHAKCEEILDTYHAKLKSERKVDKKQ